jgi:hypothetical protein
MLDDVTGLMWQEPPDAAQTMVTWSAAQAYCQHLELAGHCDWRLPSVIELLSIMDYTNESGLASAFSSPAPSWSSTPYVEPLVQGEAWTVEFVFGGGINIPEPTSPESNCLLIVSYTYAARCVRAGKTASEGYSVANGTVLDTATGLRWQQTVDGIDYDWNDAASYCSSNTPGLPGTGWRLSSLKEILTLVDWSQVDDLPMNPVVFPNAPLDSYWSSSQVFGRMGGAWDVGLDFGGAFPSPVSWSSNGEARCVR